MNYYKVYALLVGAEDYRLGFDSVKVGYLERFALALELPIPDSLDSLAKVLNDADNSGALCRKRLLTWNELVEKFR